MDRPILPLNYEQIEQWIQSLQPELVRKNYASIIGVLRGGAVPALMVSHAIGVPVGFLRYERATRRVAWDSSLPMPAAGSNVLLCEDIAGKGYTFADCIDYLQARCLRVDTLTAVFDDLSRIRPDYGMDGRGYFALLPWERHTYTEAYRASWDRTQAGMNGAIGEDHRFDVYAIDLDGILLPDIPQERYDADMEAALKERDALAPLEHPLATRFERVKAIVTGRPEVDRVRTVRWLRQHGFDAPRLIMRDPAQHADTPEQVALHKARAVTSLACTHFIESDPVQAMHISQFSPLLRVIWWDAQAQRGKLVSAHHWEAGKVRVKLPRSA